MKKYILAIQSCIICKEKPQFEFVFKRIIDCASKAAVADKKFTEDSALCAEFMGQLILKIDTKRDFMQTSDLYHKKYNRNANLVIECEVFDEKAFPYICSYLCTASCDDSTLTDEKGLVFMIHNGDVDFGDVSYETKNNFGKNFLQTGVTTKSVFSEFDEELDCSAAVCYAEEHFEEFIAAREKPARIVYTTSAYELGIACPSLVRHRVIGGHKRGRVIRKTPQEGDDYCIIGYDANDKPIFFTSVNSFGTRHTIFFFDFDGFIWAMELHECENADYHGKHRFGEIYKFRYDSNGRIDYYASVSKASIIAEKYEYPEGGEIICHFYYYVPHRNGTSKNIPAGYPNSPMYEDLYEISPDYKRIREYNKRGDEYVFSREFVSSAKKSKTPKPAPDSYEKFLAWIDEVLSADIPESGGVYFDICEPFEDGFSFAFEICEKFDKEDDDWACEPVYSTDFFMIKTDGQIDWEKVLKHTAAFIRKYLREGNRRNILKKYQGIGAGFADGDVLYINVK